MNAHAAPPAGLALAGGEVLLHQAGVRVLRAALDALQRELRRDGIGLPPQVREVRALLEPVEDCRGARSATAAPGRSAVPAEPDQAASALLHPIGTEEVAQMLNCRPRNARDLCARGAFPSARRVEGRWLVDRADVEARQAAA